MGTRIEDRLPAAFLTRMQAQLGDGYPAYLAAMEQASPRALRVNTLKLSEKSFENLVDFSINHIQIVSNIVLSSASSDDITNSTISIANKTAISSLSSEDITNISFNVLPELVKSSESKGIAANSANSMSSSLGISSSLPDDFTNSIPHCYLFPDDVAIGKHPLHMAGLVYVQEPSAQLPAQLLGVRPGMTVLDLCAAPGGKTGQLAAMMENTGLLVSNEPVPGRAEVLVGNVERLGITNCVVTCMYPDALCDKLAGLCDAVLVDAPCSGEGMFRRDAGAVSDWSPAHVESCALRQRAILDAADLALRPGGTLVYSTCTFSPQENEETVQAFLASHGNYRLLSMRRLYPHTSAGEGQFMAKLVKEDAAARRSAKTTRPGKRPSAAALKPCPAWDAFCADTFLTPFAAETLSLPDGRVLLPPTSFARLPEGLRILRAGVLLGEVRAGRFQPAHALAMAAKGESFLRRVPLSGAHLSAYLAGETVPCDPVYSGFCAATYLGYPLGFGKAVGGTLKNHLPKGLRIRK